MVVGRKVAQERNSEHVWVRSQEPAGGGKGSLCKTGDEVGENSVIFLLLSNSSKKTGGDETEKVIVLTEYD